MTLDPTKIAKAVSEGLSVVCATCELYWSARDANVPDGRCLAKDGCGSPIAGDVFHEYKGPITQFDQFCFVCGDKSSHAVRVSPYVRVIGLCSSHIETIQNLKPEAKNSANIVIVSKDGERLVSEKDIVRKKPTLKIQGV